MFLEAVDFATDIFEGYKKLERSHWSPPAILRNSLISTLQNIYGRVSRRQYTVASKLNYFNLN